MTALLLKNYLPYLISEYMVKSTDRKLWYLNSSNPDKNPPTVDVIIQSMLILSYSGG